MVGEKQEMGETKKDFNIILYGTLGCSHCIEMMNRISNVIKKYPEIKFTTLTPMSNMKRIPVTKLRYGNDLVKTIDGAMSEDDLSKIVDEFIKGGMKMQPKKVGETTPSTETKTVEPKKEVMGPSSPLFKKITVTFDARTLGMTEIKPENATITEVPTLLRRAAFIISKQLEEPRNI